MRAYPLLTAAPLVAALAACAAIGPSTVSSIGPNYDPGEYARAAQARDIPVTVRGSAFGVDEAALAKTVAENMKGHYWAGSARFTATPGAGSDRMFAFAIAINAPADATASALCKSPTAASGPAPAAGGPTAGGEVRLLGALCRFDEAVTTVVGRVDGATGPQDPKFAALIAAATRDLTPSMMNNGLMDSMDVMD